jgi:hypothetical protein
VVDFSEDSEVSETSKIALIPSTGLCILSPLTFSFFWVVNSEAFLRSNDLDQLFFFFSFSRGEKCEFLGLRGEMTSFFVAVVV